MYPVNTAHQANLKDSVVVIVFLVTMVMVKMVAKFVIITFEMQMMDQTDGGNLLLYQEVFNIDKSMSLLILDSLSMLHTSLLKQPIHQDQEFGL
uniref:Putative cnidarian restricted protein secreted protein n=1 Tax=Clytia hemisphaerica TaxID=252671 RepID=A0A069DLY7_9CNID